MKLAAAAAAAVPFCPSRLRRHRTLAYLMVQFDVTGGRERMILSNHTQADDEDVDLDRRFCRHRRWGDRPSSRPPRLPVTHLVLGEGLPIFNGVARPLDLKL